MNAYMRGKASARIFADLRAARAKQEETMEFGTATGAFAERHDEWGAAKRGQPRGLGLTYVYRLKKKRAARTLEHDDSG